MQKNFKKDILKIPNLMSMFRIILIPVFLIVLFSDASNYIAVGILALSWLSDILDGYVARKFNQVTEFGRILDPISDKLTMVTALFGLCYKQYVNWYIFVILFAKETLMAIGAIYLKKIVKSDIISSNFWGKAATGCLYIAIGLVLSGADFAIYAIYLAVALTLIAFCTYLSIVIGLLKKNKAS